MNKQVLKKFEILSAEVVALIFLVVVIGWLIYKR